MNIRRFPLGKRPSVLALLVAIVAVLVVSTSGAFGGTSDKKADNGPIIVGSILDLTGPINIYGKPKYDATKLAIQDINAHGGVLGRKLKLVFYDAQSEISKYTLYTNKLVLQDHPVVV